MQKLTLIFFTKPPKAKDVGLKFVLWEVTLPDKTVKYDWGFGMWLGTKWDDLVVPEDYAATVVRWANTKDPVELLSPPSKIISLPGLN